LKKPITKNGSLNIILSHASLQKLSESKPSADMFEYGVLLVCCMKASMNVRRSNAFFATGGGNGVYKAPLR
jgi:hypothetical protein